MYPSSCNKGLYSFDIKLNNEIKYFFLFESPIYALILENKK